MSAPLDGIHVLDLSWVMVGPVSARYLADLGADVIKIESAQRIDPLRTLGPFKGGKAGKERSVSYHNLNAGKRCLSLNIKAPRGRDLIMRMVEWADVVLESFTPGVLDSLQLGYGDLKKRNDKIIMVSTSLLGQTGPHANGTSGVGTMGAAMSGATFMLGWPDRPPFGTFGPWTDGVAPRFIVSSVLAALHRRRRTGEGCYIDVAQAEAGIQYLAPAVYEYTVNGTIPARRGTAGSPLASPSGVYRCEGPDRWVAIEAPRAEQWQAMRRIIGGALNDSKFDTLLGRLRGRADLDTAISNWAAAMDAQQIETTLQAAGVPAHVVSRGADLDGDPHLRAAGHFRKIDDPVIGEAEIEAPRFRLSRTPHVETRRGPRIGEHNLEVLQTVCKLSEQEITALAEASILA